MIEKTSSLFIRYSSHFKRVQIALQQKYHMHISIGKRVQKYKSKKHTVLSIDLKIENTIDSSYFPPKNIIIKIFNKKIRNWRKRMENEKKNYLFLQTNFPNLLPQRILIIDEIIVYELLKVDTFQEKYLQKKLNKSDFERIALFYAELHNIGKIYGDSRLPNFLTDGKNLWVIDFEDIAQGNPMEDISNLLTSLLDLNPGIFSGPLNNYQKTSFCILLRRYIHYVQKIGNSEKNYLESLMNLNFWKELILKSIKKTADRRDLEFNKKLIRSNLNLLLNDCKLTD